MRHMMAMALFSVSLALPAYSASAGSAAAKAPRAPGDIVAVASEAGSFTTLLKAAGAAGLVDTLKGAGPLTVFAPTDAAFAKLPAGTVDKLLAQPDLLKALLSSHVVAANVMAADVLKLNGQDVATVSGEKLRVTILDGEVSLASGASVAGVVKTDVGASNGVIHVLDSVIVPDSIARQLAAH